MDVASNGDVLTVDQGQSRIWGMCLLDVLCVIVVIAIWENATASGKAVIYRGNGLNHGIKINGKYVICLILRSVINTLLGIYTLLIRQPSLDGPILLDTGTNTCSLYLGVQY